LIISIGEKMKVSVFIVTYNHEKVIAQTIESALMQKVNFEYEIVIGEDYSTDNTRQIVINYQEKYPNKIHLLLPEKNLGAHKNFINTLQACQGEYIAYLEGDDYWTADNKLQKQVDLLDDHPEYTMCFHNVFCFREDNQAPPGILNYQKSVYTIEDLLISNFISSPSVMYRARVVKEIPTWFEELSIGDWPFHILHAQQGNIGYIDEVMAAYRIHSQGAWSSKSKDLQVTEIIKMLTRMKYHLDTKYQALIDKVLEFYSQQLLTLTLNNEETVRKLALDLQNKLNLRSINLIIFPNWDQSEDILCQSLYELINEFLKHPNKDDIALLIDTKNISEEEADLYVSSVVMNWMLENEVETSEDINITFTSNLNPIEWKILLSLLKGRIILDSEDTNRILSSEIENIHAFSLDNFSEINREHLKFVRTDELADRGENQRK
jgi:glycosyltransferase involved in cell wall biosynthesis